MNEKHLVKLLWIVKACLLAVLIYAGLEVVVSRLHLDTTLDSGTARGELRATDTQGTVPQTLSPPDYAAIVQRNLFATADRADSSPATPPPPQTLDSTVPAEELGLRLVGTIAGGPTASRAIIQNTKGNVTKSYRIGDTVISATVEAIQRDAVILQYRGRPLVVKLCPGTTENRGQKVEDGRQKTPDAGLMAEGRSGPAAGADASSSASSRVGSMAEVFRKATIEPYVKNNRAEGLRITGLENLPMAQMLGLQNGDIVQSVNGQPLTSKQKAFQVLMKARTQSKVDMQLLRDGRSTELSFHL
jgi:general secretion pathway protein C